LSILNVKLVNISLCQSASCSLQTILPITMQSYNVPYTVTPYLQHADHRYYHRFIVKFSGVTAASVF